MGLLSEIKPLTPGQERLLNALRDNSYNIVGVFGPTGTGKSLFSLAYGIDAVTEGRYRRLVIVRPMIDVTTGEEITMAEAGENFYLIAREYLRDVIGAYIDWSNLESLIKSGKIAIVDSHFLKGRTFDDTVVFIDDAQALKVESLIETIVRVGKDSRLIVAADPIFQSLRTGEGGPTAVLRDILLGEAKAVVVDLGVKDIVREGAKVGLRLIMEYILRMRKLSDTEKKALEVINVRSPDADVITVLDLSEKVRKYRLSPEHVPSYLVIVKPGHLGRLVGKGGERVSAIEKDLDARVRGVELSLDLTGIIRAVHPVSWAWKRVEDVDFLGSQIAVTIDEGVFGPFVGQKGTYVRFLEEVTKELFGIGIKVIPVEVRRGRRRKR